jgi:hypothetical protein
MDGVSVAENCLSYRRAVALDDATRYIYLGDRLTEPALVGALCGPVRRADGRCVVGRGKAVVRFGDGRPVVVLRRRLRLRATEE